MNNNMTRRRENATITLFAANDGFLKSIVAAQGKATSTVVAAVSNFGSKVVAGQGAAVMTVSF
jgi:hypothetical protein